MNSQDVEAVKSSLEPIIPLKVYLALPRKRYQGDTAYLIDIASRLSLSVTLSKKGEEAKPKCVRLNKENKPNRIE